LFATSPHPTSDRASVFYKEYSGVKEKPELADKAITPQLDPSPAYKIKRIK
jgi:hypothetical protein